MAVSAHLPAKNLVTHPVGGWLGSTAGPDVVENFFAQLGGSHQIVTTSTDVMLELHYVGTTSLTNE